MADAQNVWSWRKTVESSEEVYVASRACVRVGNDVSERFPVNAGLRQGCVMSPWLLYIYRWILLYERWKRAGAAECEWWQL